MMPKWAQGDLAPEAKLIQRWVAWCMHTDANEVMRHCGLTWAGSPKTIMRRIWENGAIDAAATVGYSAELREPDFESKRVDSFIPLLRIFDDPAYQAVLARHARLIDGKPVLLRGEGWLAQALYAGKSRSRSYEALQVDCARAYRALRRYLTMDSKPGLERCLAFSG